MTRPLPKTAILSEILALGMAACTVIVSGCSVGAACGRARGKASPTVTVCDLFRNLQAHRETLVAVRGIYWFGLRQSCSERFTTGAHDWPSALSLAYQGSARAGERVPAGADAESWRRFEDVIKREARAGHREEIWVTVVGRLRCPPSYIAQDGRVVGGYGHLGSLPAELVVERVYDIEVRPTATYDYGEILRRGER